MIKQSAVKLTTTVTAELRCCLVSRAFSSRGEALHWVLDHIRENHPDWLAELARRGRELARSQNGCGYYDASSEVGDRSGWFMAQQSFRDAWMMKAIETSLDY